MEYGQIIKQAWSISWGNKYLWFFGFFAAMGGGGNYSGLFDRDHPAGTISGMIREWALSHLGLIALLGAAAAILFVVLIAIHLISKGGLIRSFNQICHLQPDNFEMTLGYGLKYFWRILGIEIIYGLSVFLPLVLTILPLGAMVIWGGGGVKLIGITLLVLIALPLVVIIFGLGIWANLSFQIAVLEDKRVLGSIREAGRLLRETIGRSALLGLIIIGLEVAFWVAMTAGLMALAVPFIILGMINWWVGLVPGILIGLPLLLLAVAAYGTFASGYWTLAYLQLAGQVSPAGQPELSPADVR